MTRLVIAFGVGIIVGKITTAPPSGDNYRHSSAHRVTVSEGRHIHRRLASNSEDGAVEWPASTRSLKGDLLMPPHTADNEAPQVANDDGAVRPRDPRPAREIRHDVDASALEDGPQAVVATRVALAEIAPPDDSNRSLTTRQRGADALPPIIIGHSRRDHEGGVVEAFAAKYEKIKKSGRKVEIDGPCVSACTIVASLPKDQVCVTPRASLGVHLASDSDEVVDVQYTDWAVKKYYPKALQDWIRQHGGLQKAPKFVRGKDLLTIFNAC
jgi:hypothetical protein